MRRRSTSVKPTKESLLDNLASVARTIRVSRSNQRGHYTPRVDYGVWHIVHQDDPNKTVCNQVLESPIEVEPAYPKLAKRCSRCLR